MFAKKKQQENKTTTLFEQVQVGDCFWLPVDKWEKIELAVKNSNPNNKQNDA